MAEQVKAAINFDYYASKWIRGKPGFRQKTWAVVGRVWCLQQGPSTSRAASFQNMTS